jgi:hypothetical protein
MLYATTYQIQQQQRQERMAEQVTCAQAQAWIVANIRFTDNKDKT